MRLFFSPLFFFAFLAGCTQTEITNDGVVANGAEGRLEFVDVQGADLGTVPIGTARTLKVARYSARTVQCTTKIASGGFGHLPIPDVGGPGCEPVDPNPDAATLQAASCDDDACTVDADGGTGFVVLHVRAKGNAARATRLHVTLTRPSDGVTWSDSIAVAFAPAAKMRLLAAPSDAVLLRTPMLPGQRLGGAGAEVLDANGNPMSVDKDALTFAASGAALVPDADGFLAAAPGHATLTWELPGSIRRTADVEVVAPSHVVSIEPHAITDGAISVDPIDVDSPTDPIALLAEDVVLSRLQIRTTEAIEIAMVAKLDDGRRALASVDHAALVPATLADATVESWAPSLVEIVPGEQSGDGALTMMVGAVSAKLSMTVTVR